MARLNVNPTRMELTKLKKRLVTAQRGHKLLKDKRDELMKQFLSLARQNRALRRAVEQELDAAYKSFVMARGVMSDESMEEALMFPKQSVGADIAIKNIMSVNVPEFHFTQTGSRDDVYAYGLAETSGELDLAIDALAEVTPKLLELAGACYDSAAYGNHPFYHHEAGGKRTRQHYAPDEGEGYDDCRKFRGQA